MNILKLNVNILLILVLLVTASCDDLRFGNDFLEEPPTTDGSIDDVYSSTTNAMQALTQVYMSLPDGLDKNHLGSDFLESLTDINNTTLAWATASVKTYYYTGQMNTSLGLSSYKCNFARGWAGIRDGWLFIENVDRVPDMSPEEKKLRKAEAKMIIALHYADMMRHYGSLPWVGKAYTPNEDYEFSRMTIEETVNKIVELLDEVAVDLPWTVTAADDGRMTKAAALALKVRVLLFAASPILNDDVPYMDGQAATANYVWYGNKDIARWQRVVESSENFMDSLAKYGVYSLVDTNTPRADFQKAYFKRANNEVLISVRSRKIYWAGIWSGGPFNNMQFGSGNTTLDYVNMFPRKDGSDFDWNNPAHAAKPFFDGTNGQTPNRDPRLYETVLINEDKYVARRVETFIGGIERRTDAREKTLTSSGFAMRKFRLDVTSMSRQVYSWPYLRLAEFYLSYAEALNEVGRTSDAYQYINMIKDRVNMPHLASGLSQDEFREAVLRERALEFGYEEVRFFDLVRWKRDDIFRKKLQGLDIRKSGTKYTYELFELTPSRTWQGDGWDPKWYFSPFPQSEINKQYGLIQNPGW